jgi:NTE family protein
MKRIIPINMLLWELIPIWVFNPTLHLRTELYGFFPYTRYQKGDNQRVLSSHQLANIQYIAEASLVYNLPFASLSLFVNNYSYPKGNWNIGINLGYLLFGRRFIE